MEDVLKQWVVKLLQQLDVSFGKSESDIPHHLPVVNEEKATLLYLIDTYNKHLFEIENHSVRKVRDKLDSLAKAIVETDGKILRKIFLSSVSFFQVTELTNTVISKIHLMISSALCGTSPITLAKTLNLKPQKKSKWARS
jgi:hypothetical protein